METTTREPERHLEDARASLVARIEELGRRMREARRKLGIRAHIAAHPVAAVGVALAFGALLGSIGRRPRERAPKTAVERGLGGAIAAALAAFAMGAAKNLAMRRVANAASQWLDRDQPS